MNDETLKEHVDLIREVFVYLTRFKEKVFVIKIDYPVVDHPYFSLLVKDLVMLHRMGIKIVLIVGAKQRIDQILDEYRVPSRIVNSVRISPAEAIPFIKMAAFDAANKVMTLLSGNNTNAVIGNWVRARSLGVQDGVDYQYTGTVDKVKTDLLRTVIQEGHIPIFPCIGWSSSGVPYNISSNELASVIAIQLSAEKLFFVTEHRNLEWAEYANPPELDRAEGSRISRLSLKEARRFLEANREVRDDPSMDLVRLAAETCRQGVQRVHIVDGRVEGVILKEIFSNLGSGTMIYSNQYESIRAMEREDISDVLRIMQPLVERGFLVPRTEEQLVQTYRDFVVYEVDGTIHGCGALHAYPEGKAEIAGIAVDGGYASFGIGRKVVTYLLERGRAMGLRQAFVLTTQATDFFNDLGFRAGEVRMLPEAKREKYDPKRKSRVLVYHYS